PRGYHGDPFLLRVPEEHHNDDPDVEEGGDGAAEHTHHDQGDRVRGHGRLEHRELTDETAGVRYTGEAEEEQGERPGHGRVAAAKARPLFEVAQFLTTVLGAHQGDDRERTERGEPVGGQVEHGARETVGAGRHHGGEDEPGVHDRGVGQETFDVALGHGHDRGDHHGENGHGPQHGFPHLDGSAEGYEEHPQQSTERGNHGAGPHERGDGGGSTLVDVGLP